MAQYVYSMMGVGKVVPPKKHILKDISLSFFPGAKIGVLGLILNFQRETLEQSLDAMQYFVDVIYPTA